MKWELFGWLYRVFLWRRSIPSYNILPLTAVRDMFLDTIDSKLPWHAPCIGLSWSGASVTFLSGKFNDVVFSLSFTLLPWRCIAVRASSALRVYHARYSSPVVNYGETCRWDDPTGWRSAWKKFRLCFHVHLVCIRIWIRWDVHIKELSCGKGHLFSHWSVVVPLDALLSGSHSLAGVVLHFEKRTKVSGGALLEEFRTWHQAALSVLWRMWGVWVVGAREPCSMGHSSCAVYLGIVRVLERQYV